MSSAETLASRKAELRRALAQEVRDPREAFARIPARARAWLTLAPGWPSTLARRAFPLGPEGLASAQPVIDALDQWTEAGLLERSPMASSWDATWYAMPATTTALALQSVVNESGAGASLLPSSLVEIGRVFADLPEESCPPSFRRFLALARAADRGDSPERSVAAHLDAQVRAAIEAARRSSARVCPEGSRWIEATTPLAEILGRDVLVAVERGRRRIELYERQRRDERMLRFYQPRPVLEQAFVDLVTGRSSAAWALHYMGDGGFGKTMLVRRITTAMAAEHNLLTSRIDFDQLNPDYPARAPGLLLLALAEDLQLSEDTLVADKLQPFYATIGTAHRRMQGADRSGTITASGQVDELMKQAVDRFVDVLGIVASRQTPVFIFDTCEELARIRPTGELSDAVSRTFALLEELHSRVDRLRIVFSGRRPLASRGDGWEDARSKLPERLYLRRAIVSGFDGDEATQLLERYERADRPLVRRYWPRILELSRVDRDPPGAAAASLPGDPSALVAKSRREAAAGPRYNPFEIDLYASWLTTADVQSPERLLNADAHEYTRERIVLRVNEQVRPWLPILAQLGRFDAALLTALSWQSDQMVDNVVTELRAQEWVDAERGAVWKSIGESGSTETTWIVQPRVQERLARFFQSEEPERWRESRRRLRAALPAIVLERPWSALVPEYFAVAFDVLADTPAAAAQWWDAVEAKIVRDAAWPWAREVLARVSEEERVGTTPLPGHPVEALLCATGATVRRRQNPGADPGQLSRMWQMAADFAERVPDPRLAAIVHYRGRAGAVGSSRWSERPLEQRYVEQINDGLERVPTLDALEQQLGGPLPVELLGTELGLIENLVEILERVPWQETPQTSVTDAVQARIDALAPRLEHPPDAGVTVLELAIHLDVYRARLARFQPLRAPVADAIDRALARADALPEMTAVFRCRDWVRPESLRVRVWLEAARLKRFKPAYESALGSTSWHTADETLDSDRLHAISALMVSDNKPLTLDPNSSNSRTYWTTVVEQSLRVNASNRPARQAHTSIPPAFEVTLCIQADQGDLDEAMARAQAIAQSTTYPLDVRRAAERALVAIAVKWRRVERGVGRQTSLAESTSLIDRAWANTARAMDTASAVRVMRWRDALAALTDAGFGDLQTMGVRALSAVDVSEDSSLDNAVAHDSQNQAVRIAMSLACVAIEPELALRTLVRLGPPNGTTSVDGPSRLVAQMKLEEGALLIDRRPEWALSLLVDARDRFAQCGDQMNAACAALNAALALAKLGRANDIQAELDRAGQAGRAMTPAMPVLPADAVSPAWTSWNDRVFVLAQLATGRELDAESKKRLEGMAVDAPHPAATTTRPKDAASDPAPPGSLSHLLRRLSTVGAGIVGVGLALAGLALLYKAWVWFLGLGGLAGGHLYNVATLLAAAGIISQMPLILRVYVRQIEQLVVTLRVVRIPTDRPVSSQRELAGVILTLPIRWFRPIDMETAHAWAPWHVDEPPERWRRPYVDRARFPHRELNVFVRAMLRVAPLPHIETIVVVPLEAAGEAWEAMMWARRPTNDFDKARFAYTRRSTLDDVPTMWGRLSAAAPPPFKASPVIVRCEFSDRYDERFLQQVWTTRTTDNKYFGCELRVRDRGERSVAAARVDAIGIVHLVGPIFDDERGLTMQSRFPSELVSEFPETRLFVLQLPLRSEDRRTDTDRLDASRARVFAAQLFEAGAAAVMVVPSLSTELAIAAMQPIATVALARHKRAAQALAFGVRDAQEPVVKALGGGDIAVIEVPFDFCFYCRQEVSLHVTGAAT